LHKQYEKNFSAGKITIIFISEIKKRSHHEAIAGQMIDPLETI
tara:strand:+ start:247717 stop:247845 length:129 start_codon:yes stop_codon:yes gene_type:complete